MLPTTKHALVIQGTEEEKQQACIEIRDWAVKNGIPIHEWFLPTNGCFRIIDSIAWDCDRLDTPLFTGIRLEALGFIIHHTVYSFKKVFEIHEPVPTPFGEAIILLRDLADLQNGAPLEQYRKEWEETMEKVYSFLNRWDNPIELTNPKN